MTQEGQAYLAIAPFTPLPREIYEKGVRAETTELQRHHPRLKSTVFIGTSDAERKHIAQEGIFEALLVKDGNILEGMTSNFFYIGKAASLPYIGTARDDILLGITRQTIIDIADEIELEVKLQPLRRIKLETAAEAFLTSSSRGVVPVVQIDQVTIGQGSPGPFTKQLLTAYEESIIQRAEKI
jgi:branched-chain amino acid aminotransferase